MNELMSWYDATNSVFAAVSSLSSMIGNIEILIFYLFMGLSAFQLSWFGIRGFQAVRNKDKDSLNQVKKQVVPLIVLTGLVVFIHFSTLFVG